MTKYHFARLLLLCCAPMLFSGCGAYFNQPLGNQEARIGEMTGQTKKLYELPPPKEAIIVGVYNFRDQTGQYKNIENGSTFSTAVTQGATTILIKALEDSKWFRPIERENLQNLLNERNIILTTREQYRDPNGAEPARLNPLLFAGVLLEGGIISYDTNILTGGVGARYFGTGGSTEYRQDRITIYLRATSTATGEILKTVNVSKTILSQAVDFGIFKYVKLQHLLETETGFTKNEPTQLAVQEAIEKAVELLILEGIKDKLWATAEGEEKDKELVDAFLLEKELEASTSLYERRYLEQNYRNTLKASGGSVWMDGDYSASLFDFKAHLGYRYRILPELSLGTDFQIMRLNAAEEANSLWVSEDFTVEYNILPQDRLSPYVYGGPGYVMFIDDNPRLYLQRYDSFLKVQGGIGLQYTVSNRISFFVNGEYNFTFTDKLDNEIQGRRDDYYLNFGLGINYHFGRKKSRKKEVIKEETIQEETTQK